MRKAGRIFFWRKRYCSRTHPHHSNARAFGGWKKNYRQSFSHTATSWWCWKSTKTQQQQQKHTRKKRILRSFGCRWRCRYRCRCRRFFSADVCIFHFVCLLREFYVHVCLAPNMCVVLHRHGISTSYQRNKEPN